MTDKSTKPGRLTLPIERGIDAEVRALVERLGADAVRNSDGTELPEWVDRAFAKVYSTYFPAPVSYTHLDVYKRQVTKLIGS